MIHTLSGEGGAKLLDDLCRDALIVASHEAEDGTGDVARPLHQGNRTWRELPIGMSVETDCTGEPEAVGRLMPGVAPPKQKPIVKIGASDSDRR